MKFIKIMKTFAAILNTKANDCLKNIQASLRTMCFGIFQKGLSHSSNLGSWCRGWPSTRLIATCSWDSGLSFSSRSFFSAYWWVLGLKGLGLKIELCLIFFVSGESKPSIWCALFFLESDLELGKLFTSSLVNDLRIIFFLDLELKKLCAIIIFQI